MSMKRVDLKDSEIVKGDPANIIVGEEEKSARKHAPTPTRRAVLGNVRADIKLRMQELKPAVNEFEWLAKIDNIIEEVKRG